MNAIQAETAKAFEEILRDAGVPVTIGDIERLALVSLGGMEIDLEEGGFRKGGFFTVKMLVSHLSALPALNDIVLVDGERHKIEQINRKPGSGIVSFRVQRR